jgi:hypothetical protein
MNQYSFKRNNVAFQKLMLNNIDFIEERGIKEEGGGNRPSFSIEGEVEWAKEATTPRLEQHAGLTEDG